jgi:hypothetical protein
MTNKGSKYKCEECGIVVVVDEPCDCTPCNLICCGVPMQEVKPKAKKATKAKPKAKQVKKTKKAKKAKK